jgi:hypothetical protein
VPEAEVVELVPEDVAVLFPPVTATTSDGRFADQWPARLGRYGTQECLVVIKLDLATMQGTLRADAFDVEPGWIPWDWELQFEWRPLRTQGRLELEVADPDGLLWLAVLALWPPPAG